MSTTKRIPTLTIICGLISMTFVAGCGSDDETAEKPDNGFVVVNDDEDANQITVPVNPGTDTTAEETTKPPVVTPPSDNVPPAPENTPPSVLSLFAERLGESVPTSESSVETLQKYITILNDQPRAVENQQQQMQLVARLAPEIANLCDMMLSKDRLTQTEKLYAYNAKYTALSQMIQLGDKKALARLGHLTATMSAEEDELIAKNGRLLGLQTATHKRLLDAQGNGDMAGAAATIANDVESWIEGNENDAEVFAVLQGIGLMLVQVSPEQGNDLMHKIAIGFQDSEVASVAIEAKATLEQPAIDESQVYPTANNYINAPNSEENKTAFLAAVDKVLSNEARGVGTIRTLMDIIQRIEDDTMALVVLDKTGVAFSDIEDEEVRGQTKVQIETLVGGILFEQLKLIDKFRSVLIDPTEENKAAVLAAYTELFNHERMNATMLLSLMQMIDQVADADKELTTQMHGIAMPAAEELLDDEQLKIVKDAFTKIVNRVNLPGTTMALPSKRLTGEKFEWASLKGNYVVIDFWATWCGPCLAAIPHIEELQTKYADKNLKIIGYSIDGDRDQLKTFLSERESNDQGFKWPVIIDDIDVDPAVLENNEAVDASWTMPSTVYCGIQGIPTMVILDTEGKVLKTIQGAQTLEAELESLFSDSTSTEEDAPAATDNSAIVTPPLFQFVTTTVLNSIAGQADEDDQSNKLLKGNPYQAPAGLDKLELIDYLFDMQDKVSTIRNRPGFAEAVLEASQRLLAMDASDKFHLIAAETACSVLHEQAGLGNDELDQLLIRFVATLKEDPRKPIQAIVQFHQVERRILEVDELEWKDIETILNETHAYLNAETLQERHLRMAVAVVHAINQSDEFEVRAEQYQRFGKLFSGSEFKRLANYGKSIVKAASSGPAASDLVGKELKITGLTDFGQPIDWKSYRGKVVLIDFWATWCGPCRAEIPNIKALYEELPRDVFDVVAINLDREEGALATFLKEHPLPWSNVIGKDAFGIAEAYNIAALPTMMVIGPDGKILAVGHRVATLKPVIATAIKGLP